MSYAGPVQRWDLFTVDPEPTRGREQRGRGRPALVLSNDGFNQHFDVVTVVPLTGLHGKRRRVYPFEVLLPAGVAGNRVDSIVMPHQIRTISPSRLGRHLGSLADSHLRSQVELRLMEHLGIDFEAEGLA